MGRYGGVPRLQFGPRHLQRPLAEPAGQVFRHRFALLIPLVIYMYYVVIEAWCLAYAIELRDRRSHGRAASDRLLAEVQSSTADLTPLQAKAETFNRFFQSLIGGEADGSALGQRESASLIVLVVVVRGEFRLVYRGVSGGIETVLQHRPAGGRVGSSLSCSCGCLSLGTPDRDAA